MSSSGASPVRKKRLRSKEKGKRKSRTSNALPGITLLVSTFIGKIYHNIVKKILKNLFILVIIAIAGAFFYQYQDNIKNKIVPVITEVKNIVIRPCQNPILYEIGTFDPKFGISEKYFLSALKDAEAIWEKPSGKDLFALEQKTGSDNSLKINLIYDFRQQATSKLAGIGIEVKNNRASYDSLKLKYGQLKTKFASLQNAYDGHVQSFNKRQADYAAKVEYWNSRGGAPREEFQQLENEKSALDSEVTDLERERGQMNETVSEINAVVVVLNRLANTLNISVDKYNTVGASRGESFEEGVYSSDGQNREIDIYEFSSREKLVRVLAHEFGHALGLSHVGDTKAMMYELNQSNSIALTAADLAELKAKCQIK